MGASSSILDIIKPMGTIDQSSTESPSSTITQQSNDKRALLVGYITNPQSTGDTFDQIIEQYPDSVPYSMIEALNYCESNISLFPFINSMINNSYYYHRKDISAHLLKFSKENNPFNLPFTRSYAYANNPYYDQGLSNSEFNIIWKSLRQKYPTLKNDDKDQLLSLLPTIEDLKYEASYNGDQSKSRISASVNGNGGDIGVPRALDLSVPSTKGDLYRYYRNLAQLYSNFDDNIYGNIHSGNVDNSLKELRAIFLSLYNYVEDRTYGLTLTGTAYGQWVYGIIQGYLKLEDSRYLVTSISLSPSHRDPDTIESSLVNVFDKVLSVVPKDTIIVPVDPLTCRFMGAEDYNNNNFFYKYNKHLVCNALITNNESAYRALYDAIYDKNRKISVKRDRIYVTSNIVNRIHSGLALDSSQISSVTTTTGKEDAPIMVSIGAIMNEVSPDTFQYSDHEYTNEEFKKVLESLDSYNIVYIGRTITDSKKNGAAKTGTPYIVMRNGKDKRFYYLNPSIMAAYSLNNDYKIEEPLERLYCYDNVPLKDIYSFKKGTEEQFKNSGKPITFYNTDFAYSTYIASEIRNRIHYKEGTNSPRIMVLDFETEMNAIKVRPGSPNIDAKCRMVSLFDLLEKRFYCAVVKDSFHHQNTTVRDLTEHDGYPVIVDEFYDEKDLWKWLNQKLYDLDPDIITGWNVERFDLTYAIVRCKTLGVPFRSKYGSFAIIYSKDSKGHMKYSIGADGIVVMDYQKLYRSCQFIKRENYKLEYICQIELNKGKREMIVDNHDQMYYNHLREYIMYNIEDDERILDLENKLNYLKFQYEMCNVCNISWDDIFSKTKLIDGLVYNYAWDTNKTLLKERNYVDGNSNLKNLLSKEIQGYVESSGETSLDDDSIDLFEYTNEEDVEPGDKGYEGAVVLTPQKGVKELVADLDASQMYPRLMIRSNIFKDTLCGIIAIDNEKYAEQWLYDRDNFPQEILVKMCNTGNDNVVKMSKDDFGNFVKDKILTPFGTIYQHPSIKRSLVSDILINLIGNRDKYKKLRNEVTGKFTEAKESNDKEKLEEYARLMDRYDNLQTAYKALINSFYGVMGMLMYRLSDMFSAASITASGRELTRMVAHYASKYMDQMIAEKSSDVPFDHVPITVKSLIGLEDVSNRQNILYGDTDSIFLHIGKVVNAIYGSDIPLDDKLNHSWLIIDKIADYINQYVIRDILARKNINYDDFDKNYNYEFKKEIIMSKVLFGTQKKHYAMHLAIKEGKRLDKIDIKGMLAIKSDTPRFSRTLLKQLTEYILKEYNANDTTNSNKNMMDQYNKALSDATSLIQTGDVAVGRPVSLTQDIQHYSTIQAHIRGMLLYDVIFNHEFLLLDKGYQFYIKEIDWKKLHLTEAQVLQKFKERYGSMDWYQPMMKTYNKNVFFSSITIPTDMEFLDTSIFTIDSNKTKKTLIKEKVQDLMRLVGINTLDEEDENRARKNGLKKFDFSSYTIPGSKDLDPTMFTV